MMNRSARFTCGLRPVGVVLRSCGRMAAVGAFVAAGWGAHATLLIPNGSFEQGAFSANDGVMQLSAGSATITGWTVIGGVTQLGAPAGVAWESGANASGFMASAGAYFLNLAGADGMSHRGGVTTTDAIATTAGRYYQLSFDLGSCAGDTLNPVVKVTINGQPGGPIFTGHYGLGGVSAGNSYWQTETLTFEATSDSTWIGFNNCTRFQTTEELVGLDNVTLAVVPETGTFLAGFGALVLAVGAGVGSKRAKLGL